MKAAVQAVGPTFAFLQRLDIEVDVGPACRWPQSSGICSLPPAGAVATTPDWLRRRPPMSPHRYGLPATQRDAFGAALRVTHDNSPQTRGAATWSFDMRTSEIVRAPRRSGRAPAGQIIRAAPRRSKSENWREDAASTTCAGGRAGRLPAPTASSTTPASKIVPNRNPQVRVSVVYVGAA